MVGIAHDSKSYNLGGVKVGLRIVVGMVRKCFTLTAGKRRPPAPGI